MTACKGCEIHMNEKNRRMVIVLLGILLLIGGSIVIIKGVNHLHNEYQARKKAESISESKKRIADQAEARRRVALWVVQNYQIPEPIKEIGVSEIESFGLLGSGGKGASVIINNKKKYTLSGISVNDDGSPMGDGAVHYKCVKYVSDKNKTLDGVKVYYWKGERNE